MSILAQLELNEASEVDFGIEIHGTSEASSEIRFIIEGPQYGILCKCVDNNGVITASIPKLKGILPAGIFEAKLEVVVDGKFFTPLTESIEFKPMVEFDVHSAKAKPAQVMKVETKNIKVRVVEKAPEQIAEEVDDLDPVISPRTQWERERRTPVAKKPAPVAKDEVSEGFSDSKLVNLPGADRDRPVSGERKLSPEEKKKQYDDWVKSGEAKAKKSTVKEESLGATPVMINHPIVEPAPMKSSLRNNPRATELMTKIKALREQISTVKK